MMSAEAPEPLDLSSCLSAALGYAARGWRVHPLWWPGEGGGCACPRGTECGKNAAKHPIEKDWPGKASDDPEVIRAWWARYPKANVGIMTDGLVVIDVDPRNGGDRTMAALEAKFGPMGEHIRAITGNRPGHHRYLAWPSVPFNPTAKNALGPGVDFLAGHRYVVGPPSVHVNGNVYSWDADAHPDDNELAEPAPWVWGMVPMRTPEEETSSEPVPDELTTEYVNRRANRWGLRALEAVSSGVLPRHDACLWMVGQLRADGFTRDLALEVGILFQEKADPLKQEPFPPEEVVDIVDWVFRKPRRPRATKPRKPRLKLAPPPPPTPAEVPPLPPAAAPPVLNPTALVPPAPPPVAPGDPPQIRLQPGELHLTVRAAEEALLTSSPMVFQRGGQLVRLYREAVATETRYYRRPAGTLLVSSLTPTYTRVRLTGAAQWLKRDGRSAGGWKVVDAPNDVAEALLSCHDEWRAPVLTGFVEAPTLRPDGTVLEAPGYDPATGLFFDPGETVFPPVPASPTLDDARAALALLTDVLKDFPFVSDADRSVALSGILTVIARRGLRSAPMHAYNAPDKRSGKTMLANIASLIGTGRPAIPVGQIEGSGGDEEKKRLFSLLLEGHSVILFDNVDRAFGTATLCSALTGEAIRDRVLGESRSATAYSNSTFMATGNNLRFRSDMSARVVLCTIDPHVERPGERVFDRDPIAYALSRRGELAVAALTVLRAYAVAGRPAVGTKPMGGFETWASTVRDALVWAGQADPASSQAVVEDSDDNHTTLLTLMSAWQDAFGRESATVSEAIRRSNTHHALHAALLEAGRSKDDRTNPRLIGAFLSTYAGVVRGGLTILRGKVQHHAVSWRVQTAGE